MSALREIIARFGVSFDDTALKKGNAAVSQAKGLIGSLGGIIAAVSIGVITHFVGSTLEQVDALSKQSRALGISVGELQEWNHAADLSGVSAETLTGVLAKLGGGKFDKGLATLGIALKDTNGNTKGATALLDDVADKLSGIKDPAERNRKAIDVLGKSYVKMLPLLEKGAAGLQEMRAEFRELGGGFDEDFAKNAEDFNDNLTRVKAVGKGLAITVIGAILPALLDLSRYLVRVAKPMIAVLKNTQLLKAGAIALGLKGFLVLSRFIGPLNLALRGLLLNVLPLVLAFILFEDALTFLSGGDSLIGRALEKWFGKDSASIVRKFFTDLDTQAKASMDPKAGLGANLTATGLLMGNVFLQGLTDADNFYRVSSGIWNGIVLAFDIMVLEIGSLWGGLMARIADDVSNTAAGKLLTGLGLGDSDADGKRKLQLANAGVETSVGLGGNAVAQHDAMMAAKRLELAASADRIGAQLDPRTHTPAAMAAARAKTEAESAVGTRYGANGQPVIVHNKTTVTVPPGTPAQVARDVGAAAAKGAEQGTKNAATKAALSPGKG